MYSILPELKYSLLILLIWVTTSGGLQAAESKIHLPVSFVKNEGQFNNRAAYCLKSSESSTFFFNNYIVHQFASNSNKSDTTNPGIFNLRIDFENSNPVAEIVEGNPLPGRTNFFLGNDSSMWKTDLASFGNLTYKELYTDIDLIYYNSTNGIKSDFIVHAGGDYSKIRLKYSGITNITVNEQGALQLLTQGGEITEHIPEAYQIINGVKIPVKVNYRVENGSYVCFDVESCNPSFDLVIDPQLVYCSYFGGSGDDQFFFGNIIKDKQQNIYFTCKTKSSNFPSTAGLLPNTYKGMYDIMLVKLNPEATQILFSTYIGGNDDDIPYDIALTGSADDIVVAGFTRGSNFPITQGVYQPAYAGYTSDGFVLKLNNAGSSLLFSTFIGSDLEDYIQDMTVDAASNIYIGGYSSSNFPTTPAAYQKTNTVWGGYDFFVAKLNPTGASLLASTMIGGTAYDRGMAIALDNSANVYILGSAEGQFPTTPGAFDPTFNGGSKDVVVCKFNPDLSDLLYSTHIGGSGDDIPSTGSFVIDDLNQVTFTGKCGNGFPSTAGAYSQVFAGGTHDAYITRLNPSFSSLVFSTYIGSPGYDMGYALCEDANKNLIITGTSASGFPATKCTFDSTFNGGSNDAFLAMFNSDASQLLYSSYIGGMSDDCGVAVMVDGDIATIVGDTKSSDLPVTSNAYDLSYNGGGTDIFMAKIQIGTGDMPVSLFSNNNSACVGQTVNFNNASLYGSSFEWNFGDGNNSDSQNPSNTFLQPGNYLITLITSNSCGSDSTAGNIKIDGFMAIDSIAICSGDSSLIFGLYQHDAGVYSEIFTTPSGCDSIFRTTLSLNLPPQLNLPDSVEICHGSEYTIVAGSCSDCEYSWSDGSVSNSITVNLEGVYQVTVSKGACSVADSVKVKTCDLFLPNVFTPNKDNVNENFDPVYTGTLNSYHVLIFNRWGQQLYESNDVKKGWDGTFEGRNCPCGVYYYIVEYSLGTEPGSEKPRVKRGSISILR